MDKKRIKEKIDWQFKVDTEKLDEAHENQLKKERIERYSEMKRIGEQTVGLEKIKKTSTNIINEHFESIVEVKDDSVNPSSMILRLVAFFIDACIVVGLNFVVDFNTLALKMKTYLYLDLTSMSQTDQLYTKGILLTLFFLILPVMLWGQSFGKKIVGIRIKRLNGDNIGFVQGFLRETIIKMIFIFGVVTIPFNTNRRALHDYIARTIVIKNKNQNF